MDYEKQSQGKISALWSATKSKATAGFKKSLLFTVKVATPPLAIIGLAAVASTAINHFKVNELVLDSIKSSTNAGAKSFGYVVAANDTARTKPQATTSKEKVSFAVLSSIRDSKDAGKEIDSLSEKFGISPTSLATIKTGANDWSVKIIAKEHSDCISLTQAYEGNDLLKYTELKNKCRTTEFTAGSYKQIAYNIK